MTEAQAQVAQDLAKIHHRCTRCNGLMLTEALTDKKCDVCKIDVRFISKQVGRVVPISKWDVVR